MAWPSAFVAGNTLTAAQLNGIQSAGLAWTAYTPTLTGITLVNGTVAAAYAQFGKTVHVRCLFQAGGSTTFSATTLGFSIPVAQSTSYNASSTGVGSAFIQPSTAATRWPATAYLNANFVNFLAASAANAVVTNLVPSAFTTAGSIGFEITYEAA